MAFQNESSQPSNVYINLTNEILLCHVPLTFVKNSTQKPMSKIFKFKFVWICLVVLFSGNTFASSPDSTITPSASILVIPYMPAMHLSDADFDIAEESEMDQGEIRTRLRSGLVKALNNNFPKSMIFASRNKISLSRTCGTWILSITALPSSKTQFIP